MSSKANEMEGKKSSDGEAEKEVTTESLMNGSVDALLTPELLYQLNKKIAQLTKVVYGLNTRGEELEGQLQAAKESEEKTRTINSDLQHRVNSFKAKIENEMGKLRELEAQANEAQIWKLECENLQRRLETEGGLEGGSGPALGHAREEIEQLRRREAALQFELDQARHAINNLKAHHDFIMRERDAQQAMESEKIVLEWQTSMAELESRYKSQIRRLTEDMEVTTSECEMLRERALRATSASGEESAGLREKLRVLQKQYDSDRSDWEMKLNHQIDEKEEERQKLTDEKLDLMRKLREKTEEADEEREELEEQLRSTKEYYEDRIEDLTANQDLLQRLVDDKEEEFEVKLKTKVVEWKSEWDMAEEGLREEIKKLKHENIKLHSEVSALRLSLENAEPSMVARIESLQEELADKNSELELKTKNFKVRIGMVESENKQYLQERNHLEKLLEEERERFKSKIKNQESSNEKSKQEFQNRLQQMKDSERRLKQTNKALEEENDLLKVEKDNLNRRIKEKEREWEEKLYNQVEATEEKVKQKMERNWIEKLKKTEETAAYDIDRIETEKKRMEISLRDEIQEGRKCIEENKKTIEDLKSKLKEARQRDGEKSHALNHAQNLNTDFKNKEQNLLAQLKELAEQEQKYQNQIDGLTMKLATKQQEVVDLADELAEARERSLRNPREEALQIEIEDLKKQIKLKENIAESIRVELEYKKNETEISKMRTARLEEELNKAKEMIESLQETNNLRNRESSRLREFESKVKNLEEELRKSEATRKDLQESLNDIETERDEELKIVQDALDEAAQEREELIVTFEKELKQLNTTNTAREQQMMEDFEWKLREMEKEHKKKMEEKERQLESRLNALRSLVESELADSLTKVAEDRRMADEKLAEVGHLRSYEAEAIQLRGVTHEFQKALRASAREMENQKIRERLLEEEIRSLKTGSQSRQSTLQRVKSHGDDEDFRQKIEKMKNEMNSKWEDKLRSECSRLKAELDDLHAEEKHLAVESMKVQKEQEIHNLKKSYELTQEEMTKKISTLKDKLTERDAQHHKEVESQRAMFDRDIWDLRMKLQKLNESSFDKQQQMEEKYKDEMERFRVDYEDRIRELEKKVAAREAEAGIDLLGQLEKEHREQMQHLEEQHKISMERLREELESDKFQAVEEARVIITKHHEYVESSLKDQVTEYMNIANQYRDELDSLRKGLGLPRREGDDPSLAPPSGLSSSQFSLSSSSDSQGSRTSQDRFYLPENTGVLDGSDDSQKGNPGLLGKVFGGGWFSQSKSSSRRGSTPSANKKPLS